MKKVGIILLCILYICCALQAQMRHEVYELLPDARSIKVGDVNNDGFVDVVVSRLNSPDNEVIFSIYLNDGIGHLEWYESISSSKPDAHMGYDPALLSFLLEEILGHQVIFSIYII